MLTLRLEREADGVAVAEEAVDDGEADEGDAARDAHGARVRPAGAGARGALGARRAAPPGRGAVPAAAAQERGAQLLHLPLQPPVLLRQRTEAPLQVLALQLRLLQLRPAYTPRPSSG